MKLEKREITLNEKDSLKDVLFMEKGLLDRYVETLVCVTRKEERERLMKCIKETAEEIFTIKDLLEK
jgi:hypothetical protein